jgi:hypothetical protein
MAETVEICEIVESFEPRLPTDNCVEVLLGGRAGVEALRVGSGGGAFRAGNGGDLLLFAVEGGPSRSTGGGGRMLAFTPIGSLFAFLVTEEPYVRIGGLLTVFGLVGRGGLSALGIGGGGGRFATVRALLCGTIGFPTCCWFKAAIRCDREVN